MVGGQLPFNLDPAMVKQRNFNCVQLEHHSFLKGSNLFAFGITNCIMGNGLIL